MKYQVQIVDWHGEEDWQDSDHYDSEYAATDAAEEYWRSDPSDPGDFECVVRVRDQDGVIEEFVVSAEPSVDFYARLK
jgi:hypothetical protein